MRWRKNLGNDDITLNQLQSEVDDWIQTIGVRYFSELTNLSILMEEVGELSRLMARKFGDQSFKVGESADNIPGEIGDILFVLTCLANQMGISLQDAIQTTIQKNTKRDINRHKNNPKL
ncbi:nucleotide pyrophosphohydrolase [Leptospira perdikensis]|uniref:nucleotide pyrophosphohydrolase n=1 Tax=Leptospira perdikensis TaxID=2484948 RepID=UPI003CC673F6